ncbi:hypothetical protein PTT_15033 [Pyrenophora teres f. teres 0-1]|uniref:NAD-dependent epimerase/dehydratase domain-containing protein n=1 Tax=Pyrenophora teres f. teres (strain 0-1) TaxID=861557 RepID=E3RZF8_PYRTT|nr:hypothetical protein PTT_15033 [Pyrenophora teres f. teres 0-1]
MAIPSGKRIVFTGGSGKAGRHVIPELLKRGYQVLNLDLIDFPDPSANVFTLKTDLTDSGQVFNALTTHFNFSGYEDTQVPSPPDAVIHFAAYARNMLVPDNECYAGNVRSTYNVIEAACKLGVKKIIIASSETTYEVCFGQGNLDYTAFPLVEDMDVNPMDTYAISKLCGERYERDFPRYIQNPETRKRNAWAYIDARDLGQICDLCVQRDGLGFQVFNATNDTITATFPTKQFLEQYAPNTPVTREMGEWEAPLSNRKIKEVLGFKEEHNWRKYYNPDQ